MVSLPILDTPDWQGSVTYSYKLQVYSNTVGDSGTIQVIIPGVAGKSVYLFNFTLTWFTIAAGPPQDTLLIRDTNHNNIHTFTMVGTGGASGSLAGYYTDQGIGIELFGFGGHYSIGLNLSYFIA